MTGLRARLVAVLLTLVIFGAGVWLVLRGIDEAAQTNPRITTFPPTIVVLGLPLDLILGSLILLFGFAVVLGTLASCFQRDEAPGD